MMEFVAFCVGALCAGFAVFALAQKQRQDLRDSVVRLEAEKTALAAQIEAGKDSLKRMEETFENLSNRIFDEKSEKFKKQSEESIAQMLNPMRERLMEFQKKVDDSFGQQAMEQRSLSDRIKEIVEVSGKMNVQTENLTKALKGDSKVQGNWGEVVLERILEESGLRKGEDYIVQGTGLGLRGVEGEVQKPDVIVHLPEGKHVIIDSKVSLTHYERFFSESDEALRAGYLKQFLSAVRMRVKELEDRRYQHTDKLGTPDFVLMFMPIEAAYVLAVQEDAALHSHAWNKKVVIVCPTTLFATLKTVASVWRIELQNRNAQEIARQGGALYDKIAGFVEDMEALGRQIGTVGNTYDKAMKKLTTGKGNILRQSERMRELGAKTGKSLPSGLLDFETDAAGFEDGQVQDEAA